MPVPPPTDPAAMAATAPPPPDMNVPPPPPPPDAAQPAEAKKKFDPGSEEEVSGVEGLDQDTLMSLGAIGVFTVLLAFVLIKRRRRRASEMMTEHNVGS